jgi:Flp pilus assembly protein TadG
MLKRFSVRRFGRNTSAAAVIEFALVVPILFMLVWGIISFTRAYQRLNALTSSLREGARVASTLDSLASLGSRRSQVWSHMNTFSSAFGYKIDTTQVTIDVATGAGADVRVRVVNYPIFSGLTFLGGLSGITVSREAVFRCERECGL